MPSKMLPSICDGFVGGIVVSGAGGEEERDDYLRFLAGGSSASPIELLRTTDVDMESPLPIESAMKRFEELVAELETLI